MIREFFTRWHRPFALGASAGQGHFRGTLASVPRGHGGSKTCPPTVSPRHSYPPFLVRVQSRLPSFFWKKPAFSTLKNLENQADLSWSAFCLSARLVMLQPRQVSTARACVNGAPRHPFLPSPFRVSCVLASDASFLGLLAARLLLGVRLKGLIRHFCHALIVDDLPPSCLWQEFGPPSAGCFFSAAIS